MTAGTHLATVLHRLADEDPGRPALTCGDETLRRAQLLERAERIAALFADLGVTEGSLVTIGLPNSIDFVVAVVASWILGAVPQPVGHRLPAAERAAIVELADPALVVGMASEETAGRPTLPALPSSPPERRVSALQAPVAPYWKIITSGGSTGRPKLIVTDQPSVAEEVLGITALARIPDEATILCTAPLSHNAPFVVSTAGLLTGGHVVLMPRFDAEETLRLVEAHRVQWLYLVPTMMLRIYRLPQAVKDAFDLSSLQIAYHMAAPCPPWLKAAWIEWLGPQRIWELYGGTELQAVTVIDGSQWLSHPGSVGPAVIGEIEVRRPDGSPTEPGEVGEIWMRRGVDEPSPYRYIGATPKADGDGWESLGDLGYTDEDGYLYITDRDTDMILVGGSNVYPAEIEAALDEHPAVRSCCVIGLPHEDLGSVPHAIVELAQSVDDDELAAHLRDRLAPQKVPRSFERVSEPVRDDAGKVRRSALRADRIARLQGLEPAAPSSGSPVPTVAQ